METMMKSILSLLLICSIFLCNAQNDPGSISMTDGTLKEGLVKIRANGKVKFKSNSNSDAITFDLDRIASITIEDRSYEVTEYKNILGTSRTLMKVIVKGEATLLSDQIFIAPMMQANGAWGGGNSRILYYLKKDGATHRLGTRLNRKDDNLFDDCPELSKKIDSRDIKRRHLSEIVEFYNRNCE